MTIEDQIVVGQMPLITAPEAGAGLIGSHPDDITLWAYMYGSAQRPDVRVREIIQGNDGENVYWGFNGAYFVQSGNGWEGDLPGDFKFLYAAAVIRDEDTEDALYATYASGWVFTPDDDLLDARVFPPFQGAAGGPDGGPLFTVHGREIDMFFLPLGVRPGAILEVGDQFQMAGPVMPTLPSLVTYTVTSPDGEERSFEGRANSIGFYYDHNDNFTVDEAGLWTVEVRTTHDGVTSAGTVEEPYPDGGVLSPDGSTFTFLVTEPTTERLSITTDLEELTPASWYCHDVREASFQAPIPPGAQIDRAHVVVTMPGTVLVDEDISVGPEELRWDLDAVALNELASNFDVERGGIADTITVVFYAEGSIDGRPSQWVGELVTHGTRVARAE